MCPGYRHDSIIPRSAYRSRFESLDSLLKAGTVCRHKAKAQTQDTLPYLAQRPSTLGHSLAAGSRPGTGLQRGA